MAAKDPGDQNVTRQRSQARVWNDRIKELRRVPASQIQPHPENWRIHPQSQQTALQGVLEQVGIADAVLAYEPSPGELVLIDGHLRRETLGDTVVPVLVTDLSEDEARLILATHDPLAEMAVQDDQMMRDLLERIEAGNDDVDNLLEQLATDSGQWDSDIASVDNLGTTNASAPGVMKVMFPETIREEVVQGITEYIHSQGWEGVYAT